MTALNTPTVIGSYHLYCGLTLMPTITIPTSAATEYTYKAAEIIVASTPVAG